MNPENLRTLVMYSASSTNTQTTRDFLESFSAYLSGQVEYLHVTHGAVWDVDFNNYDVIINNYCVRLCFHNYVSNRYLKEIKQFKGLKIALLQDEYNNTNLLKARLLDLGFDVLLTCVPQDSLEYVYPRAEVGSVRIETVLTGYVPAWRAETAKRPLADRPNVIGYRGRDLGGLYGRLGYDKYEIGRRMKEICDARGIICDIRMDEDGRIYGPAWRDFLASCRVALGSESGSNVFDFDGSLKRRFEAMTRSSGRVPGYNEFISELGDRENAINMGQVSPRIFEYAEAFTPMVLFKGRYSDVLYPDEHYIVLEKDFSNIEDVIGRISDLKSLEAMADRAYEHLIKSGRYSYKIFIDRMLEIICEEFPKISSNFERKSERINQIRLAGYSPFIETPTLCPIEHGDFEIRYGFLAFRAEVERMIKIEMQVLDGFETAALKSCLQCGGAVELTSRASGAELLNNLAEIRNAFAQLSLQREEMISEHFEDGLPKSHSSLQAALSFYQRQTSEMYGLYGSINAAYDSAVRS